MRLSSVDMPSFRFSDFPAPESSTLKKLQMQRRSERSVKNLDPPGSTLGPEWITYYSPDINGPDLYQGIYYKGQKIDYMDNAIIKKRMADYQAAIEDDSDNQNKQNIKWRSIRRWKDIWSRKQAGPDPSGNKG